MVDDGHCGRVIDLDEQQRQLVEAIAREVLTALGQPRPVNRAGGGANQAPPRADIRPPIGTCTGDYSKYPELRGRLYGAGLEGDDDRPPQQPAPQYAVVSDPLPLSGIITANQLQQAWEASPNGTAVLDEGARLTPLANDLARQHPEKIRTAPPGTAGAAPSFMPVRPWLWWMDGPCDIVTQIVAARTARLQHSTSGMVPNSLSQVIRDLASGLKSGRVEGGLLFVNNAARAMCFSNRCNSIRAVLGTCGDAVEQGIAELGANVLLLEYPHVAPRAMEAMVDRILMQAPVPQPQTQRDLADLHRCG